jgi:hypothetical protein
MAQETSADLAAEALVASADQWMAQETSADLADQWAT